MATLMLSSRASTGGASASASAVAGSSRPPTPASVSEDKKSFGVYRVRQGDTLDVLARRYGVAVNDILVANPHIESPDCIQEGHQMKVPLKQVQIKQNRILKAIKVQQGNTLHGIAAIYGTSVQNLKVCNGMRDDNIFPGEDLLVPLNLCEQQALCEPNCGGGGGGDVRRGNFHFDRVGAHQAVRDLCRNYLYRRTYRRRLPNPTFLGVSFLGGPDVSDFTIRTFKALQGKQRIHVSGHMMTQMKRKDKLKEAGLARLTDEFRRFSAKDVVTNALTRTPFKRLARFLKGTRSGLPQKFDSPVSQGVLTSPFGMRWGRLHKGVDIAAETGTPIKSVGSGIVTYAGWDGPGYGHLIEIDHGIGRGEAKETKTRYAHCSEIFTKPGDSVHGGDVIGSVGETGRSTGPHLHFEVRKGDEAIDPLQYMEGVYKNDRR